MRTLDTRPAVASDLSFFIQLRELSLRPRRAETWHAENEKTKAKEAFFRQLDVLRVVESEGEAIALFLMDECPDYFNLRRLYVRQDCQGQGIGTQVMQMCVDEARQAGKPVYLEVYKTNQPAVALYQRQGFQVQEETATKYKMLRPL